jgi:Trk K+ transport system NAD-binding subunit
MVARRGEHIVPDGSTVLQSGDVVQILAEAASIRQAEQLFRSGQRAGTSKSN